MHYFFELNGTSNFSTCGQNVRGRETISEIKDAHAGSIRTEKVMLDNIADMNRQLAQYRFDKYVNRNGYNK